MGRNRVLISGAGIAGLTLAIELKQNGFEPLVIERETAAPESGYMMDFFGTGWDVASRMGLIERLDAIHYPIDTLEFVDDAGNPWLNVPIGRIRAALANQYVYLRRQDLAAILAARASELGVEIRYGTSLHALRQRPDSVHVTFVGGATDDFDLVVGADGVHSRVRTLAFGPERQYSRYLGLQVGALHAPQNGYAIGRAAKLYEEAGRAAWLYPLDSDRMDATFIVRRDQPEAGESIHFLRAQYRGAGWIAEDVLNAHPPDAPLYLDSACQIVMPQWHRGRVALIGDACGCLTLVAGQGSHMAMAGGYVLARELARHADHRDAFAAYQAALKPHVDRKQREAARFAAVLVPTQRSHPWLRRLALRMLLSESGLRLAMGVFGARSVLEPRA
jgi:2-polyprenyl-6-methoxyphenol hydroxylase-like FAD-dependent oxidoreductase